MVETSESKVIGYHDIAMGVFGRFLEGFHINGIDKINYYSARKEYYKLRIKECYGREKRWFKKRVEGCEEALISLGLEIPRKKLESQLV